MSNALQRLLKRIAQACKDGPYIFRGTNQVCEVSSAIWRKHRDFFWDPNTTLRPVDIENNIVERARSVLGEQTNFFEVLTDLRHFGGDTTIIDFTRNLFIALFFACDGNLNKPGQIIALPTKNISKLKMEDYGTHLVDVSIFDPARTVWSSPRSIFQNSVFAHAPDGVIPRKLYEKFTVPQSLKAGCLEFLRKFHNIYKNTVYNDLIGFIDNEDNNTDIQKMLYSGISLKKSENYARAVKKFDDAIKLKPNNAQLYSQRGNAKYKIKDYRGAKEDFDQAISLDPKRSSYYYSRGLLKKQFGDTDGALHDYDIAITLDPKRSTFYYSRGLLKKQLGDPIGALQDHDVAIELSPKRADCYYSRGLLKKQLGDPNGALLDHDIAIELAPNFDYIYPDLPIETW